MVVDHCAVVLVPEEFAGIWLLRMIGRITAPVMCFFIAEGYYYTSNLRRYMRRLLVVAIASHLPHNLCMGEDLWQFWEATSIMVALLLGLIALYIWKHERLNLWEKLLGVCLCCLLAYSADWNYVAVLWIVGFGIFHGDRRKQLLALALVGLLYLAQPLIYSTTIPYISRLGIFLAAPLIWLYNGNRGRRSKLIQWGFYWFYPVHLMVLYVLNEWAIPSF